MQPLAAPLDDDHGIGKQGHEVVYRELHTPGGKCIDP
jgi:hypothetical protein